jgi:hypothetical protein
MGSRNPKNVAKIDEYGRIEAAIKSCENSGTTGVTVELAHRYFSFSNGT